MFISYSTIITYPYLKHNSPKTRNQPAPENFSPDNVLLCQNVMVVEFLPSAAGNARLTIRAPRNKDKNSKA